MATNISSPQQRVFVSKYYQRNEFAKSESTTSERSVLTWTESISGIDNPRWQEVIKALGNASTAYSRIGAVKVRPLNFTAEIFHPRLYGYSVPNSYLERWTACEGFLPTHVIPATTSAENQALGNFLVKAGEALSPFKGMVFLGELRETLRMIRHPASALRDGFSSYLKRAHRVRKERNASKVLAGTWLEYVYGWKPLISDIESACEAYLALGAKVETARVFASATEEAAKQQTSVGSHHNYIRYDISDVTKTIVKSKMMGVVKYPLSGIMPDAAERLIDLGGFNLAEFVPTVWELIPYSFVVDYFSNIGVILNSIHGLTANFAWYCQATTRTTTRTVGYKLNTSLLGPGFIASGGGGPCEATLTNYVRAVPALQLPTLSLTLPTSPWVWANLLALASS